MAIPKYKPTTPGRRGSSVADFVEITRTTPEKSLTKPLPKKGGRNNQGRITTRHQGGGHKRAYRIIDFRRYDKDGIPAKVAHIEYDPNRTARIALLHYADGEKRYIIAPKDLRQGAMVESGANADIKTGNNLGELDPARLTRQHAGGVEAEHPVQPAEREPRAQAHRQLDDLRVGVVRLHPPPELVVEAVVVERVPLGVLRRQPRPLVEVGRRAPVGHGLGEGVLDLSRRRARCASPGRTGSR